MQAIIRAARSKVGADRRAVRGHPSLWSAFLIPAFAIAAAKMTAAPLDHAPFGPIVAETFSTERATNASAPSAANSPSPNRVELLSDGYEALLVRIHLIRQATTSIDVQTFIWKNDECGRLMMFELLQAARRGVNVRIIADSMFSEQNPEIAAFLATAHPNLQLKHYRPTTTRMKPSLLHTLGASVKSFHAVNQRMHNKVMVFDGAILITGGRNIENAYYDLAPELNYRDRDVLAVGPVARAAAASFQEYWDYRFSVATKDLVDVDRVIAKGEFRRYESREDFKIAGYFGTLEQEADDAALIATRFVAPLKNVTRVTFVCDEPGKSRGFFSKAAKITRELRGTLEQARSSVVMQTPYLVLSNPARDLFRELQRRHPGLTIRISSNSFASTDNLFAYSANYRLRNRYVQDLNLQVHELKPLPASMPRLLAKHEAMTQLARQRIASGEQSRLPFMCLHAKSLVVDDRVAFVGSYNLDPRSEALNTEVGLVIEDTGIARELRDEIEADMRAENSWVIARRSLPLRLEVVNGLVGGLLSLSPLDVWPIQNTSSFELRPGAQEVAPTHPRFHDNYREAGAFPGTEGLLSTKEILTRIYKAVGTPLTPIL